MSQLKHFPFKSLSKLWFYIRPKRRRHFVYLLLFTLIASIAEIVSIGAVIPFLGALTNPESIITNTYISPYLDVLGISSEKDLLKPMTLIFIFASISAGLLRILLLWATTRLSFSTGSDLSFDIYQRTLEQSYEVHISRNSSEIISAVTSKANTVIISIIVPCLIMLSSLIFLFAILLALIVINPIVSILLILGFTMVYLLIAQLVRKRLHLNGQNISEKSNKVVQILQEGLGGIRNILIDSTQKKFSQDYRKNDLQLRHAQGDNIFITQSPRFGVESLGMVLIAIFAYAMSKQPNGLDNTIPILGAMALGAQRSLPLMQRIFQGWSSLRGGLESLKDIINLLDQPHSTVESLTNNKIPFESTIVFSNVSYCFDNKKNHWIFKNINLNISKGSSIGIIGQTGSGKTTLVDLLMGLLEPKEGEILVDGFKLTKSNMSSWQSQIAHVPQEIYLADRSIAENIAFGVDKEEIDMNRVVASAKKAHIHDLIESWTEKYEAFVGERGIKLSGGQIQRIAIARALYKQAVIIVFDEATSALDGETEQSVMEAIESLGSEMTIVMIAHRLSTLRNCDQVISLGKGGILQQGSYAELVGRKI